MKVDTLEKLYQDQMATLRQGNEDLQALFPQLLSVVTNADLRNLIRNEMAELREQTTRLEERIAHNMVTHQVDVSAGMRGLIDECHRFLERASAPAIIDAGIVACCQKFLHVMIAGHSTIRDHAILLNRNIEAESFQTTLNELTATEQELRRLALDVIYTEALSAGARAAS